MPGRMAPLKKPRNAARLPLALNPLKSKDVLAVLAERNQAIVPVGAWVEPALPDSSEVPAYTSAYMIEEELKEQLRKKQEALKHFQRQVKRRVNQQIRLRKKHQLQRSYEAAEKEGSIAMQSSDPAHLTPKRTSVFPKNLNAAIGSARLPPSQVLGDGLEDRENQNELLQQQAQALSQTMKQARHRLASFKTVNKKNVSVFPDGRRKTFPHQEEPDSEESSSILIDKKGRENLFWGDQQDLLSEDRDKPFSRVQKAQFKNPLFAVMKEEEQKQLDLQGLQDILPEAQDYLPEAQGDLLKIQGDLTGVQSVELEAKSIEPKVNTQVVEVEGQATEPEAQAIEPEIQTVEPEAQTFEPEPQAVEPEAQATEPDAQAVKTETQDIMPEAQNIELEDGSIVSEVQDLLPKEQCVLPTDQNVLLRCQDQDFLPKNQVFPPKDQNILPKCQDQHVLSEDQNIQSKFQDQDFLPRDQHQHFLFRDLCVLPRAQDFPPRDQKANLKQPASILTDRRGREAFPLDVHQDLLHSSQDQTSIRDKKVRFKESYSDMSSEKGREGFSLASYQYLPPKLQDYTFIRDQNKCLKQPASFEKWEIERRIVSGVPSTLCFRQQPSVGTAERWQEDLFLDGHQQLPPKHQREASSRRQQVYGEYQSRLNTEFQIPPALQSGVDQEEDKKERQKQYLRYRRLFMDIEREQVKEQQRQKEHQKKAEKIKKKKEQQRYAEEQRILRMNFHEEPCSGEKMSEKIAQLQLEEVKEAREKQQQREKECQRYTEALRAQIQEKMQLYNITLPPLCCCGPDFWDAHPDTCANNCIFYKNPRAYTRALHSVINSCDIPVGNSALRVAMHNLVSAHRRTLKNV
ncbi:coiled-coil domain-containing protein 15 isoform X3 [Panthera uncia]|uniref:coiled-coil domain-containing protein 15 isoform X3 n=1 Tax=Panthera uncia TaxID=29064 RepID=UPI0020FFD7BB|nr:coiled-coil domain-containing protein 15 isoform X3 [Panthera uncia]